MLNREKKNAKGKLLAFSNAKLQKIPFKATKRLCMAQKLSKVNMEHMSCTSKHYVIVVTVTDSQYVGGYAASCTRIDEVF